MRRGRILAASTAVALAATGLAAAAAGAVPLSGDTTAAQSSTTATNYVVLTDRASDATAVADSLQSAGYTVTSVNKAIGLISVTSTASDFASAAKTISGVKGVSAEHSIGEAGQRVKGKDVVENEASFEKSRANGTGKKVPPPPPGGDPLDGLLWDMSMINANEAHAVEKGDNRVTVGVIDTGVQGDHPDLAPHFDAAKSRNFTTDIEAIDGPCEYTGCVDPANVDDNGHGTHVAGTIGAASNGLGITGIAPDVTLVNVRAGQDSGYFFLAPTVNALTYAGDAGIDVVNMSFYVDPWLYNCQGGAPQDSSDAAADQDVIIEAMNRALTYAHGHGVTLVAALGNNHEDISNPRHDFSSPDYDNPANTWDNAAYERTIDNDTCFDLPVEGPFVIGVSALGPSGMKSDYSNYASDLTSGELEVSAPGGWFRDGYGTDSYRTNGNEILSSAPTHVLQAEGLVDKNGNITKPGRDLGVMKQCDDDGNCGYYQWLQGTSMASPHAAGVAALAVSRHGAPDSDASRGFTLAPDAVKSLLQSTAIDHACPVGVVDYTIVGRSAEFNATCNGTPEFNSFYGAGIVNALGVVQ
jgi:lantibiotic leader peptide-processing serine protease